MQTQEGKTTCYIIITITEFREHIELLTSVNEFIVLTKHSDDNDDVIGCS